MIKFIFLLIAIIVAVGVGYYYIAILPGSDAEPRLQPGQQGAAANIDVRTHTIPAGAVMEDGTIME